MDRVQRNFSPNRAKKIPLKISCFVDSQPHISSSLQLEPNNAGTKYSVLNKSVQQQVMKAKSLCQQVKKKGSEHKMQHQNSETVLQKMQHVREKGKIIENNQFFEKLTKQYNSAIEPSLNSMYFKKNNENGFPKKQSDFPKKQLRNSAENKLLQSLQQTRQIQSFMLDEDEQCEQSFVEEHGNAVLDWGVCKGKATQFKILKFLDEGKYGKVYLAQSHRNGVIYSVKSIYRNSMDSTVLQQFIRQVKIQTFLHHPNIVRLYNVFVDDDSAYLVLQPCLGKNLFQNMKQKGKIPEKTVKQWIRQICNAVEYMHKNDIIHRDIKPQNILLHENVIKICDFGWAIHSPLLRGTLCGTPIYTPPQIVSKIPYDSKIDIWSIGVLTYQLLYGTIPFQIRQLQDMNKIIEQQVFFSQETVISEAAKDFMINCMHKNPNDRYSIRQLLEHEFLNRIQKYRWTIM